MKLSKSKNTPQILFEKDLPQLQMASLKNATSFDSNMIATMLFLATILTLVSGFVLRGILGDDF